MTKTWEEEFEKNIHVSSDMMTGNKYCSVNQVKGLGHGWVAPEDHQAEIEALKSQLQQQALPVVPECVAEAIEKDKQANVSISDVFEATFSYENHHLTEAGLWTKNNPEQYIVARNIGYTVEKPQLFYLKNKLTGDCLAICLARASSGLYVEVTEKWLTRKEQTSYKLYFTQQEIASMQTGSYEQIEVAE